MSLAFLVPLSLMIMARCGYHWTALTAQLIVEARQDRMKRHIDWTGPRHPMRRRGQ